MLNNPAQGFQGFYVRIPDFAGRFSSDCDMIKSISHYLLEDKVRDAHVETLEALSWIIQHGCDWSGVYNSEVQSTSNSFFFDQSQPC
jgi:hypothetical protein